jgi:hypothetical protein
VPDGGQHRHLHRVLHQLPLVHLHVHHLQHNPTRQPRQQCGWQGSEFMNDVRVMYSHPRKLRGVCNNEEGACASTPPTIMAMELDVGQTNVTNLHQSLLICPINHQRTWSTTSTAPNQSVLSLLYTPNCPLYLPNPCRAALPVA